MTTNKHYTETKLYCLVGDRWIKYPGDKTPYTKDQFTEYFACTTRALVKAGIIADHINTMLTQGHLADGTECWVYQTPTLYQFFFDKLPAKLFYMILQYE